MNTIIVHIKIDTITDLPVIPINSQRSDIIPPPITLPIANAVKSILLSFLLVAIFFIPPL